ncbi:hypothetical protein LTR36_002580 [Oleoguttula mirabilis]|uniref:CSC1/OSCA1-like 7TM region domain-containing protein n=1 Tax=Oleoguttula mirabilis TaxID=1507867 RepID=A0AAV9JKB6_9PEZI|nr:hypothetical protein LTR36_002580 [Oleoguttula mirabilis]
MYDEIPGVPGWQVEWLNRTLPALETYNNVVCYGLIALSLVLALSRCLTCSKKLKANADPRATKGLFYVSNIYMLNWTSGDTREVAATLLVIVAISAIPLIALPLLQLFLVAYWMEHVMKERNLSTLVDFLPRARTVCTSIALVLSTVCYAIVASWTQDKSALGRYAALHFTIGTAVLWLRASFALNFRARKLAELDATQDTDLVTLLLRNFANEAEATHTPGTNDDTVLPLYAVVPPNQAVRATRDQITAVQDYLADRCRHGFD